MSASYRRTVWAQAILNPWRISMITIRSLPVKVVSPIWKPKGLYCLIIEQPVRYTKNPCSITSMFRNHWLRWKGRSTAEWAPLMSLFRTQCHWMSNTVSCYVHGFCSNFEGLFVPCSLYLRCLLSSDDLYLCWHLKSRHQTNCLFSFSCWCLSFVLDCVATHS